MTQSSPIAAIAVARQSLRALNLADETLLVRQLIADTRLDDAARAAISTRAEKLVTTVRKGNRLGLMESFLSEYGLATDEGVALMSLAEALLRVPDSETVDELIHDKVGGSNWTGHFGASSNHLVNFSSLALSLTAEVLGDPEVAPRSAFHRAVARLGEPVIRTAVGQAMRLLGSQFVFGRSIEEAVTRAKKQESNGYTYSYDMLGEAARTSADAARYFDAYANAIARLAPNAKPGGVRDNPGISVKLSALHPRYEFAQRDRVMTELVDLTRKLAVAARNANIGFNIDAEEADRLDLSLDIIAEVLATPELAGWDGFGVVVQAYGKRVLPLIDWLDATARALDRRIMVRLVKGAYWDAEIKRAQVQGLPDYPVFTRKASTDISYIAAARKLFAAKNIYPQFATHNAHTAAAVLHLAEEIGQGTDTFEFQRLHGMGERLQDVLRTTAGTRTRIYAPVGAHKDLLAYLVRRLLENGANGSFVYQIADEDIPAAAVAEDPIAKTLALGDAIPNPVIPAPSAIFGERVNSAGLDLTDPVAFPAMQTARDAFATTKWHATPLTAPLRKEAGTPVNMINPARHTDTIGSVTDATTDDVAAAIDAAVAANWSQTPVGIRTAALRTAADLYETHSAELFALLAREAGKSWADAIAEVREAVDFLRYYAEQAELLPLASARGPIAAISPWNFPLAIFTGQIAAALVAGNPVLAKPALQTPLIAFRAVQLLHEAGIPADALQLLPGAGEVGTALTSNPAIAGVVFTGSLPTARRIDRAMATHLPATAPLVAETGGLNAMIVDSTALPEQAVRDIIASAFQSAGQRCSALRILYLQEDAAERTIEMLKGAMDELTLGDPWTLANDIGPVIDEPARAKIQAHIDTYTKAGKLIHHLKAPVGGTYVAPAVLKVNGIAEIAEEIFGPVLHIATFKADQIDAVIADINASGYGLTFGMHTRISSRVTAVSRAVRAGNIYINRNQIGAVVGSQPFGGEGLSGTGPKAGGPHYVQRFTTAPGPTDSAPVVLPGPTGESNIMHSAPRGRVLCLGPTPADQQAQAVICASLGNTALLAELDLEGLRDSDSFDAVAYFAEDPDLGRIRIALSEREGALIPLLTSPDDASRLLLERHVCIDTTAAGGNASLMSQAG
ncbi:bifunctional proline dehydrogenase/L-glutamate gamma-semialdehyde dehydrogenase PutA [Devosia sp. J2-20]|uniref:bifunctional proline dehydrogenase/L-glutamate gamma-semialdehyde dehydrogenase PutA n=1 Tax=Devosia sp. J2-20 TaxID=3026161 RepID=UPI00249AC301|nr:bifunctional proline dehydrogenase/L-glutamate gamma-semialdehyde dehydrogenase PutA [Devosia sp. J2-20]WDQ97908.1 bifunctional proline dehydrogenase/L-glutamate gamma-semialdehyde dehydrogenase PutA [Devosia sp. J2-20]